MCVCMCVHNIIIVQMSCACTYTMCGVSLAFSLSGVGRGRWYSWEFEPASSEHPGPRLATDSHRPARETHLRTRVQAHGEIFVSLWKEDKETCKSSQLCIGGSSLLLAIGEGLLYRRTLYKSVKPYKCLLEFVPSLILLSASWHLHLWMVMFVECR